jgi:hypothetical protein
MTGASLSQLRTLLDQYINEPTDNPVQEHKIAGMNMSLMIHADGFLAWHQHFLAELENWLVVNGGGKFVPLPYWNPAQPIPSQLNNGNNNVNMPLPANLQPKALKSITSYKVLNTRILPYHAAVHNAARRRYARSEHLTIGSDILALSRLSNHGVRALENFVS